LREATGWRSIVTWGPAEKALCAEVVAASAGAASAAPPTSVEDLAVLTGEAALVVAGDTGPLHIAAAQGAPLVGLYGPTWPERNGPWNPHDEVISRANTCGCHHKRQCLRGAPCIDEITIDEVFAAALRRLGRDDRS
jgi:heptosyltransferase-1